MKLTSAELTKAKRAVRRLWCLKDANGKHDMRPTVIEGSKLGERCHRCGYTNETLTPKP